MIRFIPNMLTLLNLLSGCVAAVFVISNQLEPAAFMVLLGILFDFFDGFAARALNVPSELGKQLDSLADMVTSGVVPGLVMVQMLLKAGSYEPVFYAIQSRDFPIIAWFGLAITAASAYRLANFNIDDRQTINFIGLPTPANTLFILSLPLMYMYEEYDYISFIVDNEYILMLVTVLSCYMLNAEIELFSLKFKTFDYKENKLKYSFLLVSLVLLLTLKLGGIPLIILFYMLFSLISRKVYERKVARRNH